MAEQQSNWRATFRSGLDLVVLSFALGVIVAAAAVVASKDIWPPEGTQQAHWQFWVAIVLLALSGIAGFVSLVMLVVGMVQLAICRAAQVRAGAAAPADEMVSLLRSMNDRMLLSDQAKRIAYRERDREAMRQAVIEDLEKRDYDAALALVNEMIEAYGLHSEASQLRHDIMEAQSRQHQAAVDEAMQRIDQIISRHDWDAAKREANALVRRYPNEARVVELPERIEQARIDRKHELEREFLRAAQRDQFDHAMDVLTELDRYLDPGEAERYRETAREVIGQRRQNIGMRFKLSVHDHDFVSALNVGQQIINEFPNTKMAEEVRQMMPVLRQRATEQRAAST